MSTHRVLMTFAVAAVTACGGDTREPATSPGTPERIANEAPATAEQPAPATAPEEGVLAGRIVASPALGSEAFDSWCLFIAVRDLDAAGQTTGPPLAVDRLDPPLPRTFRLTQDHTMVAGTELAGPVHIDVYLDSDCDAMTRPPTDPRGSVRAVVPAHDLEIILDRAP